MTLIRSVSSTALPMQSLNHSFAQLPLSGTASHHQQLPLMTMQYLGIPFHIYISHITSVSLFFAFFFLEVLVAYFPSGLCSAVALFLFFLILWFQDHVALFSCFSVCLWQKCTIYLCSHSHVMSSGPLGCFERNKYRSKSASRTSFTGNTQSCLKKQQIYSSFAVWK